MRSKKSSKKSSSKSTDAKVVIGEVEHEVPDEVAAEVEALRAKVEEQGAKLAELSALDAEGEARAGPRSPGPAGSPSLPRRQPRGPKTSRPEGSPGPRPFERTST